MKHLVLFSLFGFLCSFSVLGQAPVFQIQSNSEAKLAGHYLEILKDSLGILNAEAAAKSDQFKLSKAEVPNLDISTNTFWIRFSIHNPDPYSKGAFQLVAPTADLIELYCKKNEKWVLIQKNGDETPIQETPYGQSGILQEIPTGDTSQVYLIKIRSGEQLMIPVFAGSSMAVFQNNSNKDSLFLLYAGIMLVMFLYNFFIWIRTQDKTYLYYIIYILTVLITQACLEGYARELLWGGQTYFSHISVYIFSAFIGVTAIQFIRIFLGTANVLPNMDKGLRIFFLFYSISILLALVGQFNASYLFILALAMISAIYSLVLALILSFRKISEARFFLIAWTFFIVCVWVYVLKDFGYFSYNLITSNALQIGSAFEAVLLSVALADRIKKLQQRIIRMGIEEREKLEKSVKERTSELAETISNLKKTQAQLVNSEKMASLGQLTAGIAHEMNNPINFVSSNIAPLQRDIEDLFAIISTYRKSHQNPEPQIALEQALKLEKDLDLPYITTEIQHLLKGISEGATRTAEIVKGLRVFSRLDEADKKSADINEGIISTLNLLGNQTRDSIEVKLELSNLPLIECYPGKLNQVFMNILSNAVQAIKANLKNEEKGLITVKTYMEDETLHIIIKDNGPGIPTELLDKIFDPFFTTKPVGEGTGLGLSIAFSIIEKHHGKIEVSSIPGQGASFHLILPAITSPKNNI